MFKLIAIEDDRFTEIANLRVGKHKNINLNYSAADVAWNHHDGKVALTSVCRWTLHDRFKLLMSGGWTHCDGKAVVTWPPGLDSP